jgi:hypothetical protein
MYSAIPMFDEDDSMLFYYVVEELAESIAFLMHVELETKRIKSMDNCLSYSIKSMSMIRNEQFT